MLLTTVMKYLTVITVLLSYITLVSTSQSLDRDIDPKHVYTVHGDSNSAVQLDVLVDLLCPFSADTYNTIAKLTEKYDEKNLAVNIIVLPLPYHRNSYMVSVAAEIVHHDNGTKSAQHEYFTEIFNNQDNFGVAVTQTQVIRHLARSTATHHIFNNDDVAESLNVIRNGLVSDTYETHTRQHFKYIVEHINVASTPNYWINGRYNDDIDSDWTVKQWIKLLDQQLHSDTGSSRMSLYDQQTFDTEYMEESVLDDELNGDSGMSYTTIICILSLISVAVYYVYTKQNKKEYDVIGDQYSAQWPTARPVYV